MSKIINSCDGGHDTDRELRVLPFGNGNLILCQACYRKEMQFRCEKNQERFPSRIFWQDDTTLRNIPNPNAYPTPSWYDLKVYLAEEEY